MGNTHRAPSTAHRAPCANLREKPSRHRRIGGGEGDAIYVAAKEATYSWWPIDVLPGRLIYGLQNAVEPFVDGGADVRHAVGDHQGVLRSLQVLQETVSFIVVLTYTYIACCEFVVSSRSFCSTHAGCIMYVCRCRELIVRS